MHSVVALASVHLSSWSQADKLTFSPHDTMVSDKRVQEMTGIVGKEKSKRWEMLVLQQLNATSSKRISLKPRRVLSLVSMAVTEGQAAVQARTEDPKIEGQSGPTVRVRFELQRQCNFGQYFAVVGSTPQFGEWNPDAAIALNWSDGHVWTSEVDVLEGTKIEFKFVQIGQDGAIVWQPGANLILVTSSSSQAQATLELQPSECEESGLKVSSLGEAIADVAVTATIALLTAGTKIATSISGDTELELEKTIALTNGFSSVSDVGTDEEIVENPLQGDIDLFSKIPQSGLSGEEEISTLDNEPAEDLNKEGENSILPGISACDVIPTSNPDLVKRNSPSLRSREGEVFSQTSIDKVEDSSDDDSKDAQNTLNQEDAAIKSSKKPFYVPISMLVHNNEVINELSGDLEMGGHNRDEHVSSIRYSLDGNSNLNDGSMKDPCIATSMLTLLPNAVEEVIDVNEQAEESSETTTTS